MATQNNQLVVKSNKLIEARYRLSVQEQRAILFLVSKIKPEDEDFKDYIFPVSEFVEVVQSIGTQAYKEIKNISEKLQTKVFTIKEPDGTLQISWLSSAKYFDNQGIVRFRFDPALKPYLLQLKKHFTAYQLHNIIQLRSKYSVRLYELLKQYQSVGERCFELYDLQKTIGIEERNIQYGDFKRILEIARKELKAKTDLSFKYRPIKRSRKVVRLHFTIQVNTKPDTQDKTVDVLSTQSVEYRTLLNLLPKEQQRKKTIQYKVEQKLRKKGAEYVKRNILYANEQANKNYRVFLLKALKEDWGLGWEEDQDSKLAGIKIEQGMKVQWHGKEYEVQEGNCLHLPDGIVPEGELRRNLLKTTA